MNKILKLILLCILSLVLISGCRLIQCYEYIPIINPDDPQGRTREDKVIFLISKTELDYLENPGQFSTRTTIKYKVNDSIIELDSVSVNPESSSFEYSNKIYNHHFLYTKDSLVDLNNGHRYYSDNYIKKNRSNEKFIYFIINDKKEKANIENLKSFLSEKGITDSDWMVMDKNEAKEKYGINPKHITIKIVNK